MSELQKMLDYIEHEIKNVDKERIAIDAKQSCLWDIKHRLQNVIDKDKGTST